MSQPIQPGELRAADPFAQTTQTLYGKIKRVEGTRALDDTVAVLRLAEVLAGGWKAAQKPDGAVDLTVLGEHLVTFLVGNQRADSPQPNTERVWGGVLRGEAVASPRLRQHFGMARVQRAVEDDTTVRLCAELLERGLTATSRGTGQTNLEALAAWLLRETRGTPA